MEAQYNSKVYINPNYKSQRNKSRPNKQHIYLNQNFVESNLQSNNVNRIFVNPNFIKVNNASFNLPLTHQNYSDNVNFTNKNDFPTLKSTCISYNQQAKNTKSADSDISFPAVCGNSEKIVNQSRYTLVRNHTTQNIDSKVCTKSINYPTYTKHTNNSHNQVSKSNLQLPISKSRYQLVRRKENIISHIQLPVKPRTLKISKYKMITLDNSPNKVCVEDNRNKFLNSKYYECSQNLVRGMISNADVANKNNVKCNGLSSPSIRTTLNRTVRKSYRQLGKKLNYQAAIENIKGKSKINNIPCPLFSKYGKCLRNINGKCPYIHDKKHVSLCRKFLKGICHDENCCLSHELSKKKMPTCYFYLKGMCVKEDCPYLHVKLSEQTKICKDFVKGYCEKGEICLFRHVKQRKSTNVKLHSSNKLEQNKPVKKVTSIVSNTKSIVSETPKTTDNKDTKEQEKNGTQVDCRYFKGDDLVKEEFNNCDMIKPTRCKLGVLPSYIKL